MLTQPVSLGDIKDIEAFCSRLLDTSLPSGMFLRPDERPDELANLLILLSSWYRPVDLAVCGACGMGRGEPHAVTCPAQPAEPVRAADCVDCGAHRDSDHEPGCPAVEPEYGCHHCRRGRGSFHEADCPDRHSGIERSRYDPARTPSFALYARYRITAHALPDISRRLLRRNGAGIAERSHAELDERADRGHRPWDAPGEDSGDLLGRGARDRDGLETGRVGDPAWGVGFRAFRSAGRAANGARSAQRALPESF